MISKKGSFRYAKATVMNMTDAILAFLKRTQGTAPPSVLYRDIARYAAWWRGLYEPFHISEERYGSGAPRRREMYKMGMAKKICEDWAGVLVNDRTSLTTGDILLDRVLIGEGPRGGVLTADDFWGRLSSFVEIVFALGTGAAVAKLSCVECDEDGAVVSAKAMALDFIPADRIFPLHVENGRIVSCAFAEQIKETEDGTVAYVSVHEKNMRTFVPCYELCNRFGRLGDRAACRCSQALDGVVSSVCYSDTEHPSHGTLCYGLGHGGLHLCVCRG